LGAWFPKAILFEERIEMMRRILMCAALLCLAAAAALAQGENSRSSLTCNDGSNYGNSRARHCEVKEQTLAGGGALDVDASQNGGISVKGWERNEVLVRYRVQTQAQTQAEADNLASQIQLSTAGGQIRANGPEPAGRAYWDVSYEIFVPRQSSLSLHTHNGGISVTDVSGRVQFEATNGGVALKRLGGNVSGETVNGGLAVELTGSTWEGEGLDVKTTNGGLSVSVPENYSAHLETGTVNGGLNISPSIAEVKRETKRLSLDLGGGGTNLRIYTTNGGVSIRRRGSKEM
jgi:Putative adhesin